MDLLSEAQQIIDNHPGIGRYSLARQLTEALGTHVSEKKARRLLKQLRPAEKAWRSLAPQDQRDISDTVGRGDEKEFPTEQARKLLARGPAPLKTLAEALRQGERETAAGLESLRGNGYDIRELPDGRLYLNQSVAPEYRQVTTDYYGNTIRFGVVADTHLSSGEERLDDLREFYLLAGVLGIRDILHAGDITAGVNMYPGQMQEVLPGHYGYDPQLQRIIDKYPRVDGITTYLISGNHDHSFVKLAGANICAAVSYRRPDIVYAGAMAGRVTLGGVLKVDLLHPDGGMPYARSYRAQKVNEGYGRTQDIPHVLVLGHLHVSGYLPYLGIHEIQAGCFEGQTTFLRRKGIFPEIGGWICEANLNENGRINRFVPEWISF